MTLIEALEIVISLARQNIDCDNSELSELMQTYSTACDIVEDMAVNQLGEE